MIVVWCLRNIFFRLDGWMEFVQDCIQLWASILVILKTFPFLLLDSWLIVHYINCTQYKDIFCCRVLGWSYRYIHRYFFILFSAVLDKGKALPFQAIGGPEGSRKLRPLDFLTTARYGGRLSAVRTGRLYPQGYSWYSFSLGSESTPGPWCGRKEICHWKIQWQHRESIPGPSD